ncbi:unnamed protein product [Rotaria magnacalcarata]|uniref:Uncharacterized protein n=1 Tax=Rotaria magnacalcarata TaxID=392030 RepID=A0A818WMC4_9BILA|nr:unnamed protein product [Rotaria magnacalcarata]
MVFLQSILDLTEKVQEDHTKFQYLNAGTGRIGGAFVHANHFNTNLMILDGWWGNSSATRFAMFDNFDRASGANGFRINLAEMDEINMSIDVYDKDDRIDIVAEKPVSKQQKQHFQLTLTKLTICGEKKNFF